MWSYIYTTDQEGIIYDKPMQALVKSVQSTDISIVKDTCGLLTRSVTWMGRHNVHLIDLAEALRTGTAVDPWSFPIRPIFRQMGIV